MKTRNRLYIAALLVPAILLAASGAYYGAGPGGGPDTPETSPFADNAAVQGNTAAVSPFPLRTRQTAPSPWTMRPPGTTPPRSPRPPFRRRRKVRPRPTPPPGRKRRFGSPPSAGSLPPRGIRPDQPVNRGIFYVNDKLYRWMSSRWRRGTSTSFRTMCASPCATSSSTWARRSGP